MPNSQQNKKLIIIIKNIYQDMFDLLPTLVMSQKLNIKLKKLLIQLKKSIL